MLALTQSAADAVQTIVTQPEVPDTAVVRISQPAASPAEPAPETVSNLHFALAPQPEDGDVVVEGVRMSIEPTALDFLDDKVLDADVADRGVQFSLLSQPPQT